MTGNTKALKNLKKATLVGALATAAAVLSACGPANTDGVSMTDVAQAAARGEDRVGVHDLATWLIEGRGAIFLSHSLPPEKSSTISRGIARWWSIPMAPKMPPRRW